MFDLLKLNFNFMYYRPKFNIQKQKRRKLLIHASLISLLRNTNLLHCSKYSWEAPSRRSLESRDVNQKSTAMHKNHNTDFNCVRKFLKYHYQP